MNRFFFNFREGRNHSHDEEGSDFETLEEAYLDIYATIQEMWGELLAQHRDPRTCAFEITDPGGVLLIDVPFVEVLDACGPGEASSGEKARELTRPGTGKGTRAIFPLLMSNVGHMDRLTSELRAEMTRTAETVEQTRSLLRRPSTGPVCG